jgi:D-tyrosyl-tRNA(Tyr) deacylase
MAKRLVSLRVFDDGEGRLNRSVQDVQGELLLVPQITLSASLSKGTRPSFHTAAPPEAARELFERFVLAVRTVYPRVSTGLFQAHMVVRLENDGPVTFVLTDET